MRRGAASFLTLILYAAVILSAITVVLNVAMPTLDRMQDSAAIQDSITFLTGLETVVNDVASGSEGASQQLTLSFQRGTYRFDNATEELYYEIDTRSSLVSTHAVQQRGPLTISADADVAVTRTTINGTDCYLMENQHLEACIRRVPEAFNASAHPSLAGFWRFDEGTGQWANDTSQYGHDATLGATTAAEGSDPAWVPGIDGTGIGGATDTYANASSPAGLDVTGNVSLAGWTNASGPATGRIAGKGGAYALWVNGSTAWFQVAGQNVSASRGSGWVHVAGVYNGTHQRLYVNGTRRATRALATGPSANTADLLLGDGVNGTVDAVRVYNRTLTGEEVAWTHLQQGDVSYVNTSEMLVSLRNTGIGEELNASLKTYVNGEPSLAAGTGFTTAETGEQLGRGRVVLNVTSGSTSYKVAYDLYSGADFLALRTSGGPVDNTTHVLDLVLDDAATDSVVIDDEQRGEGVYRGGGIDFGYVVGQSGGRVAGLVPGGGFHAAGFTRDGTHGRYRVNLTVTGDTVFLPFTEGSHGVIEDRESAIQGSLFGSANFLGFPSPNFAYTLTRKKTVRVALSFDSIVLNGFDRPIDQGTYTITVSKVGVSGGDAVVNVTAD
ncbi:MAG: LamG domain-containing protein [Candidatus Nanohaloarchaea archaeon]|nr:LamG domain-containing protein [Candidatus Nanohaloarchaea archaeon]